MRQCLSEVIAAEFLAAETIAGSQEVGLGLLHRGADKDAPVGVIYVALR